MAPRARSEATGFPCIPIRDARSAEWELMSALSLTPNVREHRFQMHHYRGCAGDPLMSWRGEPLSFAYFSLRQAKKSRCPPRTGATLIDQYQFKERPTPQAPRTNPRREQPKSTKGQRRRQPDKPAPRATEIKKKPHAAGTQTNPHRTTKPLCTSRATQKPETLR
jgi:hypothetical protein